MTEIHNNKDIFINKAAPSMKGQKTDPTLPPTPESTSSKDSAETLNTVSKGEEVLGRSMVRFKGKDSLQKDIAFLQKYPDTVANANEFYDYASSKYGAGIASHLMRGYAQEFKH